VFGLPAAPASVGEARRTARELLDEWGVHPETCEDAVLVISELVTNALTHTASEWIVCRLRVTGEGLHIEVEDQNSGRVLPARRRPGPDDQNGRGLMLVGVLSSDWGVRDTPQRSGRVVWAELPSEGRETAEPAPPTA
jgi:anti-sigma regulatory factor (Ser/Thr protein kinase)